MVAVMGGCRASSFRQVLGIQHQNIHKRLAQNAVKENAKDHERAEKNLEEMRFCWRCIHP